jgi:UDP-glucose 4-epimerase
MCELLLKDFDTAYGMKHCVFRYFNAAGADPGGTLAERHDPETHLIPLVLQAAAGTRKDIQLFGTDYDTPDGTCIRDYIHVNDLSDAHILGLDYLRAGKPSDVFNLGSESGFSVREVIGMCERVTGRKVAVKEGPRRPGDAPRLVADAAKAKRVLGWRTAASSIEFIVSTAWESIKRSGMKGA